MFRKVLTAAQMRAIESGAMARGDVSGPELMERAGAAVVEAVLTQWPEYRDAPKSGKWRAIVLCGPGNNGGDGYVVARLLAQAGWEVTVHAHGDPEKLPGDAHENYERWCRIGPVGKLRPQGGYRLQADVLIDALFGIGLSRPVDEFAGVFEDIYEALHNMICGPRSPGIDRLVAIDVPSGLCADSGRMLYGDDFPWVKCDLTVTFHKPKPGHLIGDGPEICGTLHVANIGLHTGASDPVHGPYIRQAWVHSSRVSKLQGNKFSHGHALILAGGVGQGGAARLAARAALRIGAGLVTVCPPVAAMAEHALPPDALMRRALEGGADLQDMLDDTRITALCLGPGCGVKRAGGLLAAGLVSGRAMVLDADALTAMAHRADPFAGVHDKCVLTPHMGEFSRLFPDLAERLAALPVLGPACSRLDAAQEAASRCGAVVLLKGPDTVIAAPDGQVLIHSAFDVPWLATAGAGDVLAGMITGLLARGFDPLTAAGHGALLHACAARRFGPGLISDDLPEQLPGVFRDLGL